MQPTLTPFYADDSVTVYAGDCLDVLRELPDASVDSVVTDPPYALSFMGRTWDSPATMVGSATNLSGGLKSGNAVGYGETARQMHLFQQWCEHWAAECLRVLKPGGHMLAFGGSRTWHRLTCAIEDAGFEIRDSIAWIFGSGFPKSLNVSKDARFCQCNRGGLDGDNDGLRGVRDGVSDVAAHVAAGEVSDLFAPVQRQGSGTPVGDLRAPRTGRKKDTTDRDEGTSEPGVEGRRDVQAAEGQLHRPEVRPLPTRVSTDGTQGRLHHGASAGHGSVGGPDADALGDGQSHQPRPEGQSPGESGVVPVERGPQAWGGWPVCERCSQPAIPDGLGTALKPAFEPIVVARKPLSSTVAANVLAYGTGALNVDGCRVEGAPRPLIEADYKPTENSAYAGRMDGSLQGGSKHGGETTVGRWPSNVVLDESQADELDRQSGTTGPRQSGWSQSGSKESENSSMSGKNYDREPKPDSFIDQGGGASRFFPVFANNQQEDDPCSQATTEDSTNGATDAAKPSKSMTGRMPEAGESTTSRTVPPDIGTPDFPTFRYEPKAPTTERPRNDSTAHPTVKPLDLMRWLVRLVTPPGGTVLEPFAGSGTTAEACVVEGFKCVAVEREADYLPLIVQRLTKPIQVALEFD